MLRKAAVSRSNVQIIQVITYKTPSAFSSFSTRATSSRRTIQSSCSRLRHYATNPTASDTQRLSNQSPIPPIKPPARKSAELHPAPRKPTADSASTTQQQPLSSVAATASSSPAKPSNTVPNANAKKSSAPSPPFIAPPPPDAGPGPGLFKMVIQDIDHAMTSGVLKPMPPGAEGWKKSWHKLKEMVKFYYYGVKTLAVEHRHVAVAIWKKERSARTWREHDFLSTYTSDLWRLLPFITVILIAEEAIPLMILYTPSLLPSTCKLPTQQQRIESIADQKRAKAFIEAKTLLDALPTSKTDSFANLNTTLVAPIAKILSLSSYLPNFLLNRNIKSKLLSIANEDSWIKQDKERGTYLSTTDLTIAELRRILGRRGFPTTSLSHSQLQQNLDWWLQQSLGEPPKFAAVMEMVRRSGTGPMSTPMAKRVS